MTGRPKLAVISLAALLLSASAAFPATSSKLSGSIAGYVRGPGDVPQMGATVLLFNRFEKLIQQGLTNERGIFGFDALPPDSYSIRVSLVSFVPALKQKIAVQPGMQSLLYVDLTSLLSSIELVYAVPGQGALMSDEWKWTLKASAAARPILRALPGDSASDPTRRDRPVGSIFSDTRGVLNLSAGDPGSLGGTSAQSDLGTAFALATSICGRNLLQVSGNVAYSAGVALPTAGFRTSYSREGGGPEIAVTMQQVYLPSRVGLTNQNGLSGAAPSLRTLSLAMHDSTAITENVRLDYGMSLDSVSFLSQMNYLSKFARISYDLGEKGTLQLAYSSGAPPTQLMNERHSGASQAGRDTAAMADALSSLSMLPRVSLLDGHPDVQRSQDIEVGYEKKARSTTLNLTAYHESVTNAAMTISAPDGFFTGGDVLPDISSRSSVLNAGSYQRYGIAASATQALGDKVELSTSAGRTGALEITGSDIAAPLADDVRSKLQTVQRFWASARASATLPLTGTQITGSYQWTDTNVIMPSHYYMTQRAYPEPGLNISLRQPIPSILGMPGRLEATAELRNMLAQGYLQMTDGTQNVLLIQAPRAVRGGLSFIF